MLHPTRRTPLLAKDGFGVLANATPDNWGRKLTLTQHTRVPLNQIEWLIAARGNAAPLAKNPLLNFLICRLT